MERLLTSEEAAALLRVSVYTVKEHARKGIVPAVKIGGVWRFSESSLLEYLRGRYPDSWDRGSPPQTARDAAVRPAHWRRTPDGSAEHDVLTKRRMASEALDAIRLRTKPGPVVALIRESRRDLESRGIRSDSR